MKSTFGFAHEAHLEYELVGCGDIGDKLDGIDNSIQSTSVSISSIYEALRTYAMVIPLIST